MEIWIARFVAVCCLWVLTMSGLLLAAVTGDEDLQRITDEELTWWRDRTSTIFVVSYEAEMEKINKFVRWYNEQHPCPCGRSSRS